MHNLSFYKISPSGNMTLLFEGLDYGRDEINTFASKGLVELGGEQVGFVDIDKGILQMAGGEFCINATRSLALLMANNIMKNQNFFECVVRTSGFDGQLTLVVEQDGLSKNVKLYVPLPKLPCMHELDLGIHFVRLPGISHVLINEKYNEFCQKNWAQQSAKIRAKYNLEHEGAVGCIWWHEQNKSHARAELYMHPIVWVKEPMALHYENSCGSGTLALGLWYYRQMGETSFIMHQPGGYLTLDLQEDIQGLKGIVGGPVHLVAKGTAYFCT